jgi:hypothetical protein
MPRELFANLCRACNARPKVHAMRHFSILPAFAPGIVGRCPLHEILLDLGSITIKNGTQFRKCDWALAGDRQFENGLSGSSTALGMARTFKALRQRSANFSSVIRPRDIWIFAQANDQ